jgi:hypothetical protein
LQIVTRYFFETNDFLSNETHADSVRVRDGFAPLLAPGGPWISALDFIVII